MERRVGSVPASDGGGIVLYLQETPLILDHSTPLAPVDLISVVVPGFNEERNVPKIYQAVRTALAGERFEMIFVDDGSSDGTAQRVRDRPPVAEAPPGPAKAPGRPA